jgi:amino-acid N-acetyltransferase
LTDQTNEPPASLDPAQPSSAALPVSAALPASAALPTDESRPVNKIAYCVRRAHFDDLDLILALLEPFVQQKKLLRRTRAEIILLMHNGYVAEYVNPNGEKEIIGFSAVEIYSRKLGEIQCLAVADGFHGNGIGSELVKACVERARDIGILEVMAISSSDAFLRKLGFDYSLPEQKRALFYQLHSRDEIFNADE